jgi:hypothetical protein
MTLLLTYSQWVNAGARNSIDRFFNKIEQCRRPSGRLYRTTFRIRWLLVSPI